MNSEETNIFADKLIAEISRLAAENSFLVKENEELKRENERLHTNAKRDFSLWQDDQLEIKALNYQIGYLTVGMERILASLHSKEYPLYKEINALLKEYKDGY